VTGANLKRRVESIMINRVACKLNFGRKLLLAGAGVFAVLVPVAVGILNVPSIRAQAAPESNLAFEVASVRPHVSGAPGSTGRTGMEQDPVRVRIENLSLSVLISISYGLKGKQQLVGPGWLNTVTFDIDAKPPAGYKREQLQYLLRNLLTDRFKLNVHHETRPVDAFALVVAKGASKLHESAGPSTYHTGRQGLVEGNQMSADQLAGILTNLLGVRVVNETGLRSMYDVKLEWTPDAPPQPPTGTDTGAAPEPGLSLFTALQEQLGLRLESKKLPADVVFVDHIERAPTEN
jgi:bla regulator protein BlaR1